MLQIKKMFIVLRTMIQLHMHSIRYHVTIVKARAGLQTMKVNAWLRIAGIRLLLRLRNMLYELAEVVAVALLYLAALGLLYLFI
jgi:hypothetical protein